MNLEVYYVFGASLVPWFVFVCSIINRNPPRHKERRGMMVKGILRKMRFLLLSKCRMKSWQKIKPSSLMSIHMSILWVLAKFHWIWTKQNFGNNFLQKYHFSHCQLGLTWHNEAIKNEGYWTIKNLDLFAGVFCFTICKANEVGRLINNRNRIYDIEKNQENWIGFPCLIPWRDRGEKAALTGKATGLWYDREMLVSWVIHSLSDTTASILDRVFFSSKKRWILEYNCFNFDILNASLLYLLSHINGVLALDWLRSVYLGRERIMPMTRKVHSESGTGGGARAVGEVNTITITTTVTTGELPLQIQFLVSIWQWLSNHLGPECPMAREDLQWVEGN